MGGTMTIYVVMQHTHGGASVPVSAWDTMTEATLDMIEREGAGPARTSNPCYTVVPVAYGRTT